MRVSRRIVGASTLLLVVATVVAHAGSDVATAEVDKPRTLAESIARGLRVAEDPLYGFSEERIIMVGRPGDARLGVSQQQVYLSLLRGPKGEKLEYKKVGICFYPSTNFEDGGDEAVCDRYRVTYRGLSKPLVLFLSIYDFDDPKIPRGLTFDREEAQRVLGKTRGESRSR